MSIFSINERLYEFSEEVADVPVATTFLLQGTDGMVAPLWEETAKRSGARAEGVAVGLPTTVVVETTMR